MSIGKKKNNNFYKEGLIIIISSPSGAGKTTICEKIIKSDKKINLSISYTTRKKRKSEIHGKHYKFISKNKFKSFKKNNSFLESANVFGNSYASPIKDTKKIIKKGKDILFDIDWQGAKQIRKKFSDNLVDIFIMPPNVKELRKRLIKRGQDDIDTVDRRMKMAFNEMYHFNEYKYVLFNDKLSLILKKIQNIILLERNYRSTLKKIYNIIYKNKKRKL